MFLLAVFFGIFLSIGAAILMRHYIKSEFPEIDEIKQSKKLTKSQKSESRISWFIDKAQKLNEFLPVKNSDAVEYRDVLARAGIQVSPETYHGFTIMAAIAGLIIGLLVAIFNTTASVPSRIFFVILFGAVGLFCPRLIVWGRARDRRDRIEADLSSTLELLAISVKAGYPLESGIKLVAKVDDGELAKEFQRVDREVSLLGMSMDTALSRMSDRCGTPSVSSFTSAIIQAHRQGTSIARILQAQAKIARDSYHTNTMTKISSLTNKMIPIVTLIFVPLIFVVALTPNLISTISTISTAMM